MPPRNDEEKTNLARNVEIVDTKSILTYLSLQGNNFDSLEKWIYILIQILYSTRGKDE